jgi:hypothetical protein
MNRLLCLLVVAVVLVASGCNMPTQQAKAQLVPMGDAAPAWGSSDEYKALPNFLEGKWGLRPMSLDPEMAKQLGLQSIAEQQSGEPFDTIYTFGQDGALTIEQGKHRVTGKWTASGNAVMLNYETYNGEPLQKAMDEVKRKEETGVPAAIAHALAVEQFYQFISRNTMLTIAQDGKQLRFGAGDQAMMGGAVLERMHEAT